MLDRDKAMELRRLVLRRDKFRCVRCNRHLHTDELVVHRLVPSDDGVEGSQENLITLCRGCREYVEIAGLHDLASIAASRDPDGYKVKGPIQHPDWHAWIYGASPRPGEPYTESVTVGVDRRMFREWCEEQKARTRRAKGEQAGQSYYAGLDLRKAEGGGHQIKKLGGGADSCGAG